jgi:site-specific DNA-cytosine methylase
MQKQRSEHGKIIRRQYKNDIGVPYGACKVFLPRIDGICGTITTFQTDNNIAIYHKQANMDYNPHPTKEDLLAYFADRIEIRKMTPIEALRLMDVTDDDISKMKSAGIAKTNLYRLAGNSIVVNVLYHIFRMMFIPGQDSGIPKQQTLF